MSPKVAPRPYVFTDIDAFRFSVLEGELPLAASKFVTTLGSTFDCAGDARATRWQQSADSAASRPLDRRGSPSPRCRLPNPPTDLGPAGRRQAGLTTQKRRLRVGSCGDAKASHEKGKKKKPTKKTKYRFAFMNELWLFVQMLLACAEEY